MVLLDNRVRFVDIALNLRHGFMPCRIEAPARCRVRFLHADAEKHLRQVREQLVARNVKVSTMVGHGPAAEEIVLIAKKEGADLIVIATHGSTGLERLVFGSVAEKVVRLAECPVLTVRKK